MEYGYPHLTIDLPGVVPEGAGMALKVESLLAEFSLGLASQGRPGLNSG